MAEHVPVTDLKDHIAQMRRTVLRFLWTALKNVLYSWGSYLKKLVKTVTPWMTLKQILSIMHSLKTNITYDSSDYHLMWNLSLKLVCADVRNSCFQFCYFFYFQSKSAAKWSGVHEKMLLPCTVKSIIPKQVTLHLPLSRCNVTDVRLKVSDLTVTGEPHIYENVFRIHGFIIVFSGCLESSKNWVQSLLHNLEVPIQFLA